MRNYETEMCHDNMNFLFKMIKIHKRMFSCFIFLSLVLFNSNIVIEKYL